MSMFSKLFGRAGTAKRNARLRKLRRIRDMILDDSLKDIVAHGKVLTVSLKQADKNDVIGLAFQVEEALGFVESVSSFFKDMGF